MEINWQPTDLKNNLVSLKPLEVDDFEPLYAIASDPKIWEQHPEKERYRLPVFQKYFESAIASKAAFVVVDCKTKEWIGCTRYYEYNVADSSIAIGFTFLTTDYWGGVYNSALKKLMIDYALAFVNKVLFHVGEKNIRSQKALMKIGAIPVNEQTDMGGISHLVFEITRNNYQL